MLNLVQICVYHKSNPYMIFRLNSTEVLVKCWGCLEATNLWWYLSFGFQNISWWKLQSKKALLECILKMFSIIWFMLQYFYQLWSKRQLINQSYMWKFTNFPFKNSNWQLCVMLEFSMYNKYYWNLFMQALSVDLQLVKSNIKFNFIKANIMYVFTQWAMQSFLVVYSCSFMITTQ